MKLTVYKYSLVSFTNVLITKGNGDFPRIGMVRMLWKIVTGILNLCLTDTIQFHETLHGFRIGRGPRNSYLEANMIHKLAEMR